MNSIDNKDIGCIISLSNEGLRKINMWTASLINYNAFKNNDGLNAVYHSINMVCARRIHMGMEYRVNQALITRAQCSMATEKAQLDMIVLRNKLNHERDYQEYKKSLGL